MKLPDYDIAIIGGGISGFAAACFLAEERGDGSRIIVIERESQPGYHTTGRSAAMYTEIYGNQTIRSIVRAGRRFMQEPEARYSDRSFLSPRGALMVAGAETPGRLDEFLAEIPTGLESSPDRILHDARFFDLGGSIQNITIGLGFFDT